VINGAYIHGSGQPYSFAKLFYVRGRMKFSTQRADAGQAALVGCTHTHIHTLHEVLNAKGRRWTSSVSWLYTHTYIHTHAHTHTHTCKYTHKACLATHATHTGINPQRCRWKMASALTARHIGGAVNYMAVSETLSIPPSVFGEFSMLGGGYLSCTVSLFSARVSMHMRKDPSFLCTNITGAFQFCGRFGDPLHSSQRFWCVLGMFFQFCGRFGDPLRSSQCF